MKVDNDRVPGDLEVAVTTHIRGHLSDLLALNLFQRYGNGKYRIFVDPLEAKRKGWSGPLITIGRGEFDEHDNPEAEECEATLVAKQLGIADRPELRPILDYTLMVDRHGQGKGILKFGRTVELLYDVFRPEEWREVYKFAALLIEAEIEERLNPSPAVILPAPVVNFVREVYAIAREDFAEEVRCELDKIVAGFDPRAEFDRFGLPWCVSLLWRHLRRKPMWWAVNALRAELMHQKLFLAAEQELDRAIVAEVNISDNKALLVSVPSDNRYVHSFCFSKYGERYFGSDAVAAVAVQKPSGQTQIFRRSREAILEFWSVVAQLRTCEQEKAGGPAASWSELISQRGPEGVARRWFFQHASQKILNGSLTAPEVEPTRLTLDEIHACLVAGLDDENLGYRRWFYLEHGGPVSDRPAQKQAG